MGWTSWLASFPNELAHVGFVPTGGSCVWSRLRMIISLACPWLVWSEGRHKCRDLLLFEEKEAERGNTAAELVRDTTQKPHATDHGFCVHACCVWFSQWRRWFPTDSLS